MSLSEKVTTWLGSWVRMSMRLKDRTYQLGDTIDVSVGLKARRDLQLKQGRVELVIQKRYAEAFTRMAASRGNARLLTPAKKDVMIPTQEIVEHEETYVHGSAVFATGMQLGSGERTTHSISLNIPLDLPPQAVTGTLTWSLTATADLASGPHNDTQTVARTESLTIRRASTEKEFGGWLKRYFGHLDPRKANADPKGTAYAWTATVLVALSVLAWGRELYDPLDLLWIVALVLWVAGIGAAIAFGAAQKREVAAGIMNGIGIGVPALAITWFDLSSLLFFLN